MLRPIIVSNNSFVQFLLGKLQDYKLLIKFRLSSIVVFSAGIGYIFAAQGTIDYFLLTMLLLGGFFITGASNAFNEILEKDSDKLMKRTANRPLPANRMNVTEAILIAGILGVLGIAILAIFFNTLSALVGAVSLLIYSFIYTPLKRVSNIAVFVGAIPGALPPIIGWIAYTGNIELGALILFSIQFLWQFPHFWAIAWVAFEDYKTGGFNLLPSSNKDKSSALQNMIYISFLIPVSLLPFILGITGFISALIILAAGVVFLWQAFNLYYSCENKHAKVLMIGSFFYLPIVFLSLIFDKI